MARRRGRGSSIKEPFKKHVRGGSSMRPRPPISIEEFAEKHGTGIKTMTIEPGVSDHPREIRIPQCPQCGGPLFLSHPVHRPDMNIEAKREAGPLADKVMDNQLWLGSCWTAECDFFIAFRLSDLLQCPECGRHCMEGYTLYDHMRYQCTKKAARPESLRRAGVEKYMTDGLLGPGKKDD